MGCSVHTILYSVGSVVVDDSVVLEVGGCLVTKNLKACKAAATHCIIVVSICHIMAMVMSGGE